jgi:predicted GNAT family N-acyltransferase
MSEAGIDEDVVVVEAIYGSQLYLQALALREAVLRRPLGLVVSEAEREDDLRRQHFCALCMGVVVGSVSLKPLAEDVLQVKQMAVTEGQRRKGIGAKLILHSEAWAREGGYCLIVLNARVGVEGFYIRHGYYAEGAPFEEHTIPHIRMTKRLDE